MRCVLQLGYSCVGPCVLADAELRLQHGKQQTVVRFAPSPEKEEGEQEAPPEKTQQLDTSDVTKYHVGMLVENTGEMGDISGTVISVVPHAASAKALDDVLTAAATLDALSLADRACAQKVLSTAPFTDASLPTKGGNVPRSEVPFIPGLYYPKSLFAANYERPLPTIGNALRKNMDAAGRELQFAKPKARRWTMTCSSSARRRRRLV